MTSNDSPQQRTTGHASVRTWVRAPFGTRSAGSTPTRPQAGHGHELPRYQRPPLV
jgi:hypothetical protein